MRCIRSKPLTILQWTALALLTLGLSVSAPMSLFVEDLAPGAASQGWVGGEQGSIDEVRSGRVTEGQSCLLVAICNKQACAACICS